MAFHILGPFEVSVALGGGGSGPVAIRGQKQRQLLAVLVVNANQSVSVDFLMDDLWPAGPTASAVSTLYGYVSQLRRALGPPGESRSTAQLQTHHGTYRMVVDVEQLDAARFEALCDRASQLFSAGALEESLTLSNEALELWRGPALFEFSESRVLQAERARLDERRSACLELRVEIRMALGGHREVLAELESLVREQPLRERLWGQLMLALYRSGRQSEALRTFQRLRQILADELGIDPSTELVILESAILGQASSLEWTPIARDAPSKVAAGKGTAGGETARRERRTVAIVAIDLRLVGDAGLDPEVFEDWLAAPRRAVSVQLQRAGGHVVGAAGGSVLAVFGAPIARGHDAEQAVQAAIRAVGNWPRARSGGLAPQVAARAGIESGEVMVNIVGGPVLELQSLAGAAVHRAEELRSHAGDGEVLVGERTRRATGASFSYQAGPTLGDPDQRCWRPTPNSLPGNGAGRLFLVDRDQELSALHALWRQTVDEGRPRLVTLLGPPGIGKTRLAGEFTATLVQAGVQVLTGRSVPVGGGEGYGAFVEQMGALAGVDETDGQAVVTAKLETAVTSVLRASEADDVLQHLAVLFGMATSVGVGDPQVLFHDLRNLLEAVGRQQPTILVFEDLHWAESSLLDLVEWLGGRLRHTAILIVALARLELFDRRPHWTGGIVATSLDLDVLPPADAERMVTSLLAKGPSSVPLARRVLQTAGGNPLFIEALTAAAAETALEDQDSLPDTVASAIAARLDALPPPARMVVTAAAVVGKIFWRAALTAQEEFAGLDEALDLLEIRGLIRRFRAGGLGGEEYGFCHGLIQEGAYRLLPTIERRARHAAVAGFIEQAAPARPGEWATALAYHWKRAGENDRAIAYLIEAAERAATSWAKREAVELYDEALELLPADDTARFRELQTRKAAVLVDDGDYRGAADTLDALLPVLEGRSRLEALLARTKAAYWLEQADVATLFCQEAMALADHLNADDVRARATAELSHIVVMQGKIDEGTRLARRALAGWPPDAIDADLAYHLELLGLYQYWAGSHRQAVPTMQRAYEMGQLVHSVDATIRSGASLALAMAGQGQHKLAFELFDLTVEQGREVERQPRFTARALNMWAGVHRDLFELDEARTRNQEGITLAEHAGFAMAKIQGRIDLLMCDLDQGNTGRAADDYEEVWQASQGISGFHQWHFAGRLLLAKARLTLLAGPPEEAISASDRAIEQARFVHRRKYEVCARLTRAGALFPAQPEAAIEELQRAQLAARGLNHTTTLWRLSAALRLALSLVGDSERAEAAATNAQRYLDTLTADLDSPRRQQVLSTAARIDPFESGRKATTDKRSRRHRARQ